MTAAVGARNLVKVDASVVHALLRISKHIGIASRPERDGRNFSANR